jgi:hypothetical protein
MIKIVSSNMRTLIFYDKKLILCFFDKKYSSNSLLSIRYVNYSNNYLFLQHLGMVASKYEHEHYF